MAVCCHDGVWRKPCDLSSSASASRLSRLFGADCTSTSRTSPSQSTVPGYVLAVDRGEDFIEMPTRIGTRVRASELSGIGQPKLDDQRRTVSYESIDAALGQHILDIAQAREESESTARPFAGSQRPGSDGDDTKNCSSDGVVTSSLIDWNLPTAA